MNRVSERNLGRFRSCTLTCKTKKYKQVCQFQHFCLIYELSKNCQRTLEYKYQYEIPHLINLNFLYVEKSLLLLRQQLVFNFKFFFWSKSLFFIFSKSNKILQNMESKSYLVIKCYHLCKIQELFWFRRYEQWSITIELLPVS